MDLPWLHINFEPVFPQWLESELLDMHREWSKQPQYKLVSATIDNQHVFSGEYIGSMIDTIEYALKTHKKLIKELEIDPNYVEDILSAGSKLQLDYIILQIIPWDTPT